jgi:hypothetical protein
MDFSGNYVPLIFVKFICREVSVVPVVKHTDEQ